MSSHVTAEYLREQGLSPTFPARFFSKVRITDSCWIWIGAVFGGYGYLGKGSRENGQVGAHVASWMLHFGPVPNGMCVCHDCPDGDNKMCVNPAHLWIGGHKENALDASSKGIILGRPHYGESHGRAKLTWEKVLEIRQNPQISASEFARRFGIGKSTASSVRRGMFWKRAHD